MYEDRLRDEFTAQSTTFAASEAARSTLAPVLELAAPESGQRWLEVACGPGVIGCALAPSVASVHGIDLTPAMVERAREDAAAAGLANATFAEGDATAIDAEDSSFDAAVTRFSLHHIPLPGRVLAELARVVRPGGAVVVSDHLGDADRDAFAWHQEIERLRDPSHWACVTGDELDRHAAAAGLEPERSEVLPLVMGYEGWLERGTTGPGARDLIEEALAGRPDGAPSFAVRAGDDGGERRLHLRNRITRWRVD